jgi:caffeoyl-CoA O-methyltransferase
MTRRTWVAIVALMGGVAMSAAIGIGAGGGGPHDAGKAKNAPAGGQGDDAKIMAVIDRLTPQIGPMLSVPPEDGRFLWIMAESTGAKNVAEIGTSNGYSGLWTCLGLKKTGGKLTTFDIDPEKVKMARANFKEAGVDSVATVVEGDAHQKIKENLKAPLDMVFIDAEKEGYVDYLKQLLPMVRPGGVILAHNVKSNARQLRSFVEAITTNPELVTVFVNTSDRGMSLSMKKN